MSLLRRKKKVSVTAPSPTYRVKYLGNVSTTTAQLGEDATSRPVKVLWDNHVKTSGRMCVPMTISVDSSGISVRTESRGVGRGRGGGSAGAAADRSESMHYWCHRISSLSAIKEHPGLFIWVYRHAGRNMKVELRCHAALCKSDKAASELAELVARVLRTSLGEYVREKQQSQRRRSLQEKVAGFFTRAAPLRKQLLSPGRSYKPPIDYCFPPQQLDVIKEDRESCTSDEGDPSAAADGGGGGAVVMHSVADAGLRGSRLGRVVANGCCDDEEDDDDERPLHSSVDVGSGASRAPCCAQEMARRSRSSSDSETVGILLTNGSDGLPLDALARTEVAPTHSAAAAWMPGPLPVASPACAFQLSNGAAASSASGTKGSTLSVTAEDVHSGSSGSSSSSSSRPDSSDRSSFQPQSMLSSHRLTFPQALHGETSAPDCTAQQQQPQPRLQPQRSSDASTFQFAGSLPDMSVTWVSYDEECNFEPGGPAAVSPADVQLSPSAAAAAGLAKLLSASHLQDGEYL